MQRCTSAGVFRVIMLHQNQDEERRQYLGAHADLYEERLENGKVERALVEASPIFSSAEPFEGELCEHELMALRTPTKFVSPELIFRIEKID